MLSMDELLKGRHFDREVIILCVRWYLRFKLSFRDLAEMMAERGVSLAHTTIMRWIARYVPEFEKRWNRFACRVGTSWRVDDTYVKIKGRWTYLYRAVDKQGKTVDFLLRANRDVAAAKAFFRRALSLCTCCRHYPGAAAGRILRSSHPAVSTFPDSTFGSACTSSFSRIARRSLALRPAHSRRHQIRDSYRSPRKNSVHSCLLSFAAAAISGD